MRAIYLSLILFSFAVFFSSYVEAGRGCCSWHGGVAGCDAQTGHQLCRDGTDSPSCACGE